MFIGREEELIEELESRVFIATDALEPLPPVRYIVDGLIEEGTLSVMYGESGSKKTWVALTLGVSVALGVEWAGLQTTQGGVLLVDEETGAGSLKRRLQKLLSGYGVNQGQNLPFYIVSMAGFDMTNQEWADRLMELIERYRPSLVLVDAQADVMPGADENLVRDVQPVFMNLRRIAYASNTAIVIIHHTNRDGGYRGSSSIKGAVNLMLEVKSSQNSNVIDFHIGKMRDGIMEDFRASACFDEKSVRLFELKKSDIVTLNATEEFVSEYLREHGPSTMKAIRSAANNIGLSEESVKKSVYHLIDIGIVERANEGSRGKVAIYQIGLG